MAVLSPLESPTFPIIALLQRVRAEYLEMPGLKLTALQARRLWGLDCATCDAALAALVDARFLSRTRDGLFIMAATPRSDHMRHMRSGIVGASDLPSSGVLRSEASVVTTSVQ